MTKIRQQQVNLWKSLAPQFQRNLDQCLQELNDRYIETCPPQQFDLKKEKIRQLFKDEISFDFSDYLDIFVYIIEEKKNISLHELSEEFVMCFGKDSQYWAAKILQWATLFTFTSSLTLWSLNKYEKNFVSYKKNIIQREVIYQWRLKIQAYITSLDFLLRKIHKLKKNDQSYVMDEAYVKYHKEKILYASYVSQVDFGQTDESKNTYIEQVTITFQNKSKADKKLFNFPNATRNIEDKDSNIMKNSRINVKKFSNTLQRYNFFKKNPKNEQIQQIQIPTDAEQKQINYQWFVNILENTGKKQFQALDKLRIELKQGQDFRRQQLRRQQQQQNIQNMMKTSKKSSSSPKNSCQLIQVHEMQSLENPEFKKYSLSHLTFIHNPDDYFRFEGYPIGQRQGLVISNPYILYPWVNYYVNDEQEYDELMAISLDGSTDLDTDQQQSEDDDEIENDEDFIDFRDVVTYDQNQDYQLLAPEDRINFAQNVLQNKKRWVADRKCNQGEELLTNFFIIPVYGDKTPYQMQGTDGIRTKKRIEPSKNKINQTNNKGINYTIQQIIENSEQDNDTTNKGQQQQHIKIQIQKRQNDEIKQNKNQIQSADEETTFEQKSAFSDPNINLFQKCTNYKQSEYEIIKNLPKFNQQNNIHHFSATQHQNNNKIQITQKVEIECSNKLPHSRAKISIKRKDQIKSSSKKKSRRSQNHKPQSEVKGETDNILSNQIPNPPQSQKDIQI